MDVFRQPVGRVFDIKRSCLHDGPGVRTTVFLKGCPLNCLWCHNPESISPENEWAFDPRKCHQCASCDGAACLFGARFQVGEEMSVDTVMADVLQDRDFFERTGGGLTLSGGEPLAQPVFAVELLKAARSEGIHSCVETCGQVAFKILEKAAEQTDLFLYDLKESEPVRHKEYTGVDNRLILENLAKLDGLGAKITLRCPIIPTLNDRPEHFAWISQIANGLANLQELHLMPFHPFADYKREQIGRAYELENIKVPNDRQKTEWRAALNVTCPVHV